MDIGAIRVNRLLTLTSSPEKKCDDMADRFSNTYTVTVLSIFATIMTFHQFVGKKIECWAPAHFTSNQVAYTNTYCWTQNTYYLPWEEEVRRESRDKQHIMYYQWMPFILMFQAVMFLGPKVLWKSIGYWHDVELKGIIEASLAVKKANTPEARNRAVRYTARQMYDALLQKNRTSRCSRKCGNSLVVCYIIVKILYIVNPVLQFSLLHRLFNIDILTYGVSSITEQNDDWSSSDTVLFPRVTMCELEIRRLGNNHKYFLLCVLPQNYFMEKIVIFLWFWLWLVLLVTILGLISWIYRLTSPQGKNLVLKHLLKHSYGTQTSKGINDTMRNGEIKQEDNENDELQSGAERESIIAPEATPIFDTRENCNLIHDKVMLFQRRFLQLDGVFIFQMIHQNTDINTTNEIIGELYKEWELMQSGSEEKDNEQNDLTEDSEGLSLTVAMTEDPKELSLTRPFTPRAFNEKEIKMSTKLDRGSKRRDNTGVNRTRKYENATRRK